MTRQNIFNTYTKREIMSKFEDKYALGTYPLAAFVLFMLILGTLITWYILDNSAQREKNFNRTWTDAEVARYYWAVTEIDSLGKISDIAERRWALKFKIEKDLSGYEQKIFSRDLKNYKKRLSKKPLPPIPEWVKVWMGEVDASKILHRQ